MAESSTFVQTFPKFKHYVLFIIELRKGNDDIYIRETFDKLSIKDIIEPSIKHPNKNQELYRLQQHYKYNTKKVYKTFRNDIKKYNLHHLLYTSELKKLSLLEYSIKGISISNISYLLNRFTCMENCIFCYGFNILNLFKIISDIYVIEYHDYKKCIINKINNDYKIKQQNIINILQMLINFYKTAILKNNNCKIIHKNNKDKNDENCLYIILNIIQCNDPELLQQFFSEGVYLPLKIMSGSILSTIITYSNEKENYIKICEILFKNGLEIKSEYDDQLINKKPLVKYLFNILLLQATNASNELIYLIISYL
jgi:hypothetical protein